MRDDHSGAPPYSRGVTLNGLKDELHSLHMRLLLAMQYHNEEAQADIQAQIDAVQAQMDRMCPGG